MMYDIDILLSIRFRTPTSKREVGVLKISTSAFLDSKYPFTCAPRSAKIQKKNQLRVDGRFKQRAKIHFQKYMEIYTYGLSSLETSF